MTVKIQPSPEHKHGGPKVKVSSKELADTDTKDILCGNSPDSLNNLVTSKHVGSSHVIYVTSQTPDPENCDATYCHFTDIGANSDRSSKLSYGDQSSVIGSESDDEAVERTRRFCWGLCCMQGCVWGILGALYFFFLLPLGFLLVLYGTNKSIPWAIASGSIILALSTCGMPSLCLCIRWYRRKRRDRRNEYRIHRNKELAKVTFENLAQVIEVPA